METYVITLRVTGVAGDGGRVTVRRQQFAVGRPDEFDETAPRIAEPRPETQLLVLEVKAAATEAAVSVTETAMRTCGGAAFGGGHGIERMFRDARAPVIMAPTTDQAHDFIGRALCGLELFS